MNNSCLRKSPDVLNMEEMFNQISTEKAGVAKVPLWMSKRDLDNRFGQISLRQELFRHRKIAVTGENMNGYYSFERNFYGLSDIATKLREKSDEQLNH